MLKNIAKVYGKKESAFAALQDISFGIPSGASLAIVGKSGSGKSTLMHLMSGLDKPTSGSIIVDNQDLQRLKNKEIDQFRANKIGFIFQSFFTEAKQSCFYNVALPLEIREMGRSQRKKLVEQALRSVDLSEKINTKAGNLSGGQKQRLAIARAIVSRPDYIFADEPTGNLDSSTGDKIVQLLFGLHKTLGSTLIIVTHDDELAAKCQLRITLKDGQITEMASGSRVLRKA